MPQHSPSRWLALALALGGLLPAAHAATESDASRISAVTLYPGSASVERVLRVDAGATSARFGCLPAQLDARSLQVSGAAGVRVGEVNLRIVEREVASGCDSAFDERLRAAEDGLARAQAETDALRLAQTWLNTQATSAPARTPNAVPNSGASMGSPAQIAATADALRRAALDTLTRLHQAERAQQQADLALKRVQAERGSAQAGKVAVAQVTLATQSGGELRLSYQVRGPSWSPSYRARLDTRGAQVQLERLALVVQTTGEDWSGVALTLSTGQPLAATQGPLPRPWTLDVQPAEPVAKRERSAIMAAPAPAAAAAEAADEPSLDVVATEGAYATTFNVPQRVDVPSGGGGITLALGAQAVPASVIARATPALDDRAWLVALLPPLTGVWPAGPIALERDGTSVGQGRFDPSAGDWARVGLAFGRDERIVVRADPVKEFTASSGFTGARSERTTERGYALENRHDRPVELQVLDAAPVSRNEAISVQSTYEPQPTELAWGKQPGSIVWQQKLAAGANARFSARHVATHDKDVRMSERR